MTTFGTLALAPASDHPELLAAPVRAFLSERPDERVLVGAIDAELADTAAFCAQYDVGLDQGANCVVVEARRGETRTLAACLVRGSELIDEAVAVSGPLIVGAGIRGAKLLVTGEYLAGLPGARVVPIAQG